MQSVAFGGGGSSPLPNEYFTTFPPLGSYSTGDYVWLIEQTIPTNDGLYRKTEISPSVFAWVQVLTVTGGGGGIITILDGRIQLAQRSIEILKLERCRMWSAYLPR